MDLLSETSVLTEGVKNTINEFVDFLMERKVLELGLAFIISTNINRVASDFIENIISPIINRVFNAGEKDRLKESTINIFGIKFEIGNFISSLLKFIITMIILYYIYKFFKKKDLVTK